MDDLWGNAWGSPDDVKDERKPVAWSTSEKSRSDDPQEDDLSMPSWSTTGPGIRWDEPSATLSPLWSTGHHDKQQDWSLDNPYDDIPLGNSSQAELPNDDSSNDLESHPTPPTTQSDDDDLPASPPLRRTGARGGSDIFSSDIFSGAEQGDIVPNPSERGSLEGQLVPGVVEDESLQHTDDEWESAKLRQLEMDRRVPPELLSRILLHLEDFAKDVWPGIPDEAEADWQRQWHSGLDVDGLEALMPRYVPSLTLPQPKGRPLGKRLLSLALKLPWTEVPLGWRILEKEGKKDEKVEEKDGDSPPSSAPSAVSRFLNRFSRSRQSSSHSRNSLTLSGDDLEYLSDVRSNSTDPMDAGGDEQLDFGSTASEQLSSRKIATPIAAPIAFTFIISPESYHLATSQPGSACKRLTQRTDLSSSLLSIPNAGGLLDARKPAEQSSVFALAPLIPGPIQADTSKSIHSNSEYSISSPSDKINPSLSATLLPTSSRSTVQRSDPPHNDDDDDDFSDFLSSPADPPLLTFSASPPSSTQVRVQPPHARSMSSDDDFANLMSLSTWRPWERHLQTQLSSIAQRRRGSRAEEHLHTLGLLERAAARPGRWPAPPSPLPEVLTPPPPPESYSFQQRRPQSSRHWARTRSGTNVRRAYSILLHPDPGRWPAPPSPFHEALLPPPPPARNQGGVALNVDFFGTTPTEESFTLPPPPPPPGKTSPPPSLSNIISPQISLGRSSSPFTGVVDAIQSSSPPPRPSAAPTGLLSRRALSPPPPPTAVISKVPPKLSSTPIPLLPPPGGYRLTPTAEPTTSPVLAGVDPACITS
ncbi:hypothetical protein H4582DRAFT_2074326 [Lactarius indigo]|nr:hypothetical protein H4582DRAFT_2074326 [Lactarius indigo]